MKKNLVIERYAVFLGAIMLIAGAFFVFTPVTHAQSYPYSYYQNNNTTIPWYERFFSHMYPQRPVYYEEPPVYYTQPPAYSYYVQPQTYYYSPLTVSCQPSNENNYYGGNYVTWNAYVSGGSGYYTYEWTGTDNPQSVNSSGINVTYQIPGTKSMYVSVISGNGQTANAYCGSVNVSGGYYNSYPQPVYNNYY